MSICADKILWGKLEESIPVRKGAEVTNPKIVIDPLKTCPEKTKVDPQSISSFNPSWLAWKPNCW